MIASIHASGATANKTLHYYPHLFKQIPGPHAERDEQANDIIRSELVVDDVRVGVAFAAREVDVVRHVRDRRRHHERDYGAVETRYTLNDCPKIGVKCSNISYL